jgi:hypothetical protein
MAQEPEGSSSHTQQPATGHCPEPVESNPHPQANLPKIHSDPIFPRMPWSSEWSLSFGLSHQNLVHFTLLSHTCHMPRPPHSPWLDLTCLMISENEYKLWSSSLCNFLHSPATSSLLGPNILLRTLFSNTLSLCSSLSVTDQVSHPYKTTGRIMVLCILVFRNKYWVYAGGLLAPLSNPRLEDHPLSAVRDCLFNIFAAGGRLLYPQPEYAPCRGDSGHTQHGPPNVGFRNMCQ